MLSASRKLTRVAPRATRSMAVKAATVKALMPELSAISTAVDALGASPSYAQVDNLIKSDPAFSATLEKVKAEDLSWAWAMLESKASKPPVTVAVVGAGSEVGAASLFRIAAGEMLGLDTPVALQLVGADAAVTKEVEACGFPLLTGITSASSPAAALKGASYAIVLEGDMKAVGAAAGAETLVAVMGNANAAAVAASSKASVTAITRAVEMAAAKGLADAAGVPPTEVENVIAWGTGVADVSHATVAGKWALKVVDSPLPAVESPKAAAAADAVVAHMKDWALGSGGKWVSMGVPAVGDYGMGEGLFYSVPVVCTPGAYKRVGGVSLTPEVADVMEKERQAILGGA